MSNMTHSCCLGHQNLCYLGQKQTPRHTCPQIIIYLYMQNINIKYVQYVTNDMYTLDEGNRKVVESGMGLFLSVGHWQKIWPQNSKGANSMCVLCTYCTLFSPLWLKFVPDWPAISVSSLQQGHLLQMIWFG